MGSQEKRMSGLKTSSVTGQSVVVESETSTFHTRRVRSTSRSDLGPSLFLFYINDMLEGIQSTVPLFADDTIAYVTISSDADAANLQQDLDKLAEWESKWLMKCHPEKCSVLTISKKRCPSKYNYTLHRHILEHDTSAKYLGCTISSDLKWGKHISTICSKANNTTSFL